MEIRKKRDDEIIYEAIENTPIFTKDNIDDLLKVWGRDATLISARGQNKTATAQTIAIADDLRTRISTSPHAFPFIFESFCRELFGDDEKVEFTEVYLNQMKARIVKQFAKEFAKALVADYTKNNDKFIRSVVANGEKRTFYSVYDTLAKLEEAHAINLEDFDEKTQARVEVAKRTLI